ncbi:hypothetical protein SDC9_195080 [bioreactor metagenome]|uniref:Uncharacterized protein n=1 Tax=bioreactor metagenome TaxID=1076179 RepID=A0A645I893_9ZZZZ
MKGFAVIEADAMSAVQIIAQVLARAFLFEPGIYQLVPHLLCQVTADLYHVYLIFPFRHSRM